MMYSTHAARSPVWLQNLSRLKTRRNTLSEGFRKNLAELQQRICRLCANTVQSALRSVAASPLRTIRKAQMASSGCFITSRLFMGPSENGDRPLVSRTAVTASESVSRRSYLASTCHGDGCIAAVHGGAQASID